MSIQSAMLAITMVVNCEKGAKSSVALLLISIDAKMNQRMKLFWTSCIKPPESMNSSPPDAFAISNLWGLLRYMIDHGLVDIFLQHSDLTACCLEYLGSSPLALTTSDEEVEERLKEGYFAFHEYASVYWFHHLLYVIEHRLMDDSDLCTSLADRFRKFVERYATAESIQLSEVSGRPVQLLSLLKKVPEKARDRNKCFDIEWRTLRIRRQLECLAEHLGPDTAERRSTHIMYGMRLFKCPKLDCEMFLEGFATRALRDKHLDRHDRPYLCVQRGCPFRNLGFETGNQLERHIRNAHTMGEDDQMLFPQPPRKHPDTLCKAAARGDVVTLKALLKQGADVNQTSRPKGGQTPLIMAAQKSRLQACKTLLEAGADLNFIGPIGRPQTTVLNHVSQSDEMIELLIPHANQEAIFKSVFYEISWGFNSSRLLKVLLRFNKIDVNACDRKGYPLLHTAIRKRRWETAKVLIQQPQIDLNSIDREGVTPLSGAVEGNVSQTISALSGITTSLLRISGEAEDIIKMLLASKRVVPDAPDNQGRTPLSKAAERGNLNVVNMLMATGSVNPNGYDHQGRTPLNKAMDHGRKEVVEALLETGKIELNARNNEGETMLTSAIQVALDYAEDLCPLQEQPNGEMRDSPGQGMASSSDVIQKHRNYALWLHAVHTQQLEQQNNKRLLLARQEQDMTPGNHETGSLIVHAQNGNQAMYDYQMQLMLLEQQNKKRSLMATQEMEIATQGREKRKKVLDMLVAARDRQ